MDPSIPLNRERAYDVVLSTEDRVQRLLLNHALAVATAQFVREENMSDEEYRQRVPDAPFDLLFYMRIMQGVFADTDTIRRLLEGQSNAFPDL